MPGLQLEYTGLGCCAGRASMMERKEGRTYVWAAVMLDWGGKVWVEE